LITVYFGDVCQSTADQAKAYDSQAYLVGVHNAEKFLDSTSTSNLTVYTSLGDCPHNEDLIFQILDKADTIVYAKSVQWSDNKEIDYTDPTSSNQGLTEYILWYFDHYKNNVLGLDIKKYKHQDMLHLWDTRKSDQPQLWVVGASFCLGNHGVGKSAFPWLLEKDLNIPMSLLAMNAASHELMSDQLLRSDVRANDIVILSLNHEERHVFWNSFTSVPNILGPGWHNYENDIKRVEQLGYKKKEVDRFLFANDTGFYKNYTHIYQVINYCNKISAKLLLFGVFSSSRMNLALSDIPQFKLYTNKLGISQTNFVDYADDNMHPGIQQHRLYADFILSNLKALEYI
jgi:hypothetical protein